MSEALLLAATAATSGFVGSLGTWATTARKNKGDQTAVLIKELMEERRYLDGELRACHEEIRKLRTDVQLLQERQQVRQAHDDTLDELDKQIRHDGSTLIRNLLARAEDGGVDVTDLKEKAKILERVRDMRREAAGQSPLTSLVPR